MQAIDIIPKPIHRNKMRKALGKEYFILKRRLHWLFGPHSFAKVNFKGEFHHSCIRHRSFLLRPLKDVDMQLQRNKIRNLSLAIVKINGVIIRPGEVFSIWKLVGRPSKRKGYLMGLALHNGKIEQDIGGGLCQLGNLIYWMALHTPLLIKERWRHSYDVFPDINRSIPFACGATLSYNYIDLQLENKTDESFQIRLWLDDEFLHGEIASEKKQAYRYSIFETDHMFKQQWWGGYTRHNKIWRRATDITTNTYHDELIAENKAIMMYNPMLDK